MLPRSFVAGGACVVVCACSLDDAVVVKKTKEAGTDGGAAAGGTGTGNGSGAGGASPMSAGGTAGKGGTAGGAGGTPMGTGGHTEPPDASTPGEDAEAGTCSADLTRCDDGCVDIASAPHDCGQCGHDCGGGACNRGICQPMTLASGLRPVGGIAVDDTRVYFTSGALLGGASSLGNPSSAAYSCPLTGCRLAPTQIAGGFQAIGKIVSAGDSLGFMASEATSGLGPANVIAAAKDGSFSRPLATVSSEGGQYVSDVGASGTDIYFTFGFSNPKVCQTVSKGACGSTVVLSVGFLSPFAVEGTFAYFFEAGNLSKCDSALACMSHSVVVHDVIANELAVKNSVVYLLSDGGVQSCAGGACKLLTDAVRMPTELAVGMNDVYWLERGMVRACSLPSCAGGPRQIAENQNGARAITTDANFVYWATAGSPLSDGGLVAKSATIERIAQ